ncbi:MAG: cytochrome c [Acidobacteria bacterium]|nr:cytochrome c [Acidobacteriota bacterium]
MNNTSLGFVRLTLIILAALIVPLAILSAENGKKEEPASQPTLDEGLKVFKKNCILCHFPDKADKKMGPGLKGLFSLKELPESHKPVDEETIRDQIMNGTKKMPGFAKKLSPEQIDNLIAYLKTL